VQYSPDFWTLNKGYLMKIRAAVAFAPHQPLEIRELDLAPPGPGEVLIRMKATGLCHSDLGILEGKVGRYSFPLVLGHEGAGEIVECGPDVTTFAVGDVVIPSALPECGHCNLCLSGKTNLCVKQSILPTSRLSLNGESVMAFCGTATFAEYAVVSQERLAKIRSDAPADVVCYVGCGVMTGIGAALKTGQVTPGSSVAVFGLGGIGLNVIQGARIAGAAKIIGVDINPDREAIARKMGATDFIDAKKEGDVVAALRAAAGGMGVDFAFECVGNNELLRQAVAACNHAWGKCVAVGILSQDKQLAFDPMSFLTGRTLTGSLLGGERPRSAVPRLVDWYMDGFLKLDELVTHRITLDEINKGFDMMRSGESIRTVIVF
jgi:S-(hydroxymethyl)glutathione dehydrogenase / alcohol dehydrogenase